MRKILTQTEIEALLSSAPDDGARMGSEPIIAYNFRRPDRVSKEQIRSLHFLHDRFARNATASLAAFLRTTTELSLVSVEQLTYAEFLMALPDPTAFYGVAVPAIDAVGALEINPGVAFTIVDRLLGGSGRTGALARALTEIELDVVDAVIRLFLEHLTETWRPIAGLQFRIQGRETGPQMLQVAGRNDIVILLSFDLKVSDMRGLLHLCLPAGVMEAAGVGFGQGGQHSRREPTATEERWLAANLGRMRLPVSANLSAVLTTRELIGLAPGQVLMLGVPLHSTVDVCVGNLVKFRGRLTTTNGGTAVLIDEVCSRSDSHLEAAS